MPSDYRTSRLTSLPDYRATRSLQDSHVLDYRSILRLVDFFPSTDSRGRRITTNPRKGFVGCVCGAQIHRRPVFGSISLCYVGLCLCAFVSLVSLNTPQKRRTPGPDFNWGSGGGARGCGFEERVGAYARKEGDRFLKPAISVYLCVSLCVCVLPLKWLLVFSNRNRTHIFPPNFQTRPTHACRSDSRSQRI